MRIKPAIKGLLRGEMAQATGCNLETIRYYEKIGIMPNPPRTANGFRIYGPLLVDRLRFVMRMRELGFTLEQMRGLLTLVDGGNQTCGEVLARTKSHLADIRAKITDLQRVERVLAKTAAKCSGQNVPDCPILTVLAG